MRMVLVAASNRQPAWVGDGFDEYARRLRGRWSLDLKEIPLAKRSASSPAARAVEQEGDRILAAVPAGARLVELTERGRQWDTQALAARLGDWSADGAPLCFAMGGPDGIAPRVTERADAHWALSRLTLPHGLARIVAAEALYRAVTVLEGHPYHRA